MNNYFCKTNYLDILMCLFRNKVNENVSVTD